MYFGQGVGSGFSRMMATHPPVQERIRRLQPHWNGELAATTPASAAASSATSAAAEQMSGLDRKSTRLNSSHVAISYAVFCLKKTTRSPPPRRHRPTPSQ